MVSRLNTVSDRRRLKINALDTRCLEQPLQFLVTVQLSCQNEHLYPTQDPHVEQGIDIGILFEFER